MLILASLFLIWLANVLILQGEEAVIYFLDYKGENIPKNRGSANSCNELEAQYFPSWLLR